MPEFPVTTCYERYKHHGSENWVRIDLKGKHRDYCLCHNCASFDSTGRDANCPTANLLFALCVLEDLVTPVWECPKFVPVDRKKYLDKIKEAGYYTGK